MQRSVLDAIREGDWDFEPDEISDAVHPATPALPGTDEKISVLAARAERGLPLWHGRDRLTYEDLPTDR